MQKIGNTSLEILQRVSENTNGTAEKQESCQLTLGGGSETRAMMKPTNTKGQVNAQTLIAMRDQAASIRSLMQEKKPKKFWGKFKRVGYDENDIAIYDRHFRYEFPEMTEDLKNYLELASLPLDKKIIVDYLARFLAINKDMRMDESKRPLRFADDAGVLFGLPEYAVCLGIFDCISIEKSNWYPPVSVLKEHCENNLIEWPKPDELEGYERY